MLLYRGGSPRGEVWWTLHSFLLIFVSFCRIFFTWVIKCHCSLVPPFLLLSLLVYNRHYLPVPSFLELCQIHFSASFSCASFITLLIKSTTAKMVREGSQVYRWAIISGSLGFVTFGWDAGVLGGILLTPEFMSAIGVSSHRNLHWSLNINVLNRTQQIRTRYLW